MFKSKQVRNGLVDAVLLIAFLAEFYMSLTGIDLHQWLGLLIGLGTGYHLLAHWKWVEAVLARFFKAMPGQSRWYAMLDAALLVGLVLIIESGVILSTWLNLSLSNYAAWSAFHSAASIITLLLLVTKLVLHWRWIVRTLGAAFGIPSAAPVSVSAARAIPTVPTATALRAAPAAATHANPQPATLQRRQFLTVAGLSSLAALLSIQQVFANNTTGTTSTAATDGGSSTTTAGSTTAASTTTTTCQIRCNRRCSFPGHCRCYVDSNNNNRCDLGECL